MKTEIKMLSYNEIKRKPIGNNGVFLVQLILFRDCTYVKI